MKVKSRGIKIILSLFLIIISNNTNLHSQEYKEIIELDSYEIIAGPRDGYNSNVSRQWELYTKISDQYSSEIIEKEYYKTNSVITKIYLYWILRERKWDNLIAIYNDLLNYKEVKVIFGIGNCVVILDCEIGEIIDFDYNEEYNETDEMADEYFLYKLFKPDFEPLKFLELDLEFLNSVLVD